jgi:Bax protein
LRAAERRAGRSLDGAHLAGGLTRYSERGAAYIDTVRAHIRANRLHLFDAARLHGGDRWG